MNIRHVGFCDFLGFAVLLRVVHVLFAHCCSTKTQVNPSSALNRIKHHQSNPSNVPGILDSNLSKRACVFSKKSLILGLTGSLPYNWIRSPTGFLPSGFTTSLVCLTSVAHVRGVSLCSLERQDSLLLQGLKVAEDPLSEIPTSTLPPYF